MKTFNMETRGTATAWIVGLSSAVISKMTSLELADWAAIVSIISVPIGLYLTWYFKRKADKRDERESKERMKFYETHKKNNHDCDL